MQLPRLFILSIAAGAGLISLQAYWVFREWKTGEDILERQVNFAFEKAIGNEFRYRQDSLIRYLEKIVKDTNVVKIENQYIQQEKQWVTRIYDPANPADGMRWKDPALDTLPREQLIKTFVEDYLVRSISGSTVVFYTQRLGKIWNQAANDLKADSAMLAAAFRKELAVYTITNDFHIFFTGIQQRRGSVTTKPFVIKYDGVNDTAKKYSAVAQLQQPSLILLTRLWLPALATVLLLLLTLYCLWALYKVIIKQKKADQIKNDFISNMTHELKTPIATIGAAIDGLQYFKGIEDPVRTEKYLNTSRHELQRLNELVSKVLELSQFEKHEIVMNREFITAKPFAETIFQSVAMQHTVHFTWEIQEAASPVLIYGDATHLAGVLYNLADNAVRYSEGNVHLSVLLNGTVDGSTITITDNGPGIGKEYLPYIFDKFYRVPGAARTQVKGFGLGLFYVARVVEQHGGTIQVTSNPSTGTTFIIQIPSA